MDTWKPRPRRWGTTPWVWPTMQGIPVPKSMREAGSRDQTYRAIKATMAQLAVGECFVLAGWPAQPGAYRVAMQPGREVRQYAKDFGYRIVCRTVGRGVVMIWRTA